MREIELISEDQKRNLIMIRSLKTDMENRAAKFEAYMKKKGVSMDLTNETNAISDTYLKYIRGEISVDSFITEIEALGDKNV